jgi:hypothetical protein
MSRTRHRFLALIAVGASFAVAAPAYACSKDDSAYFDGFLDTTCLLAPLNNTTIDTFGGLRLDTNGTPTTRTWDSNADSRRPGRSGRAPSRSGAAS